MKMGEMAEANLAGSPEKTNVLQQLIQIPHHIIISGSNKQGKQELELVGKQTSDTFERIRK